MKTLILNAKSDKKVNTIIVNRVKKEERLTESRKERSTNNSRRRPLRRR